MNYDDNLTIESVSKKFASQFEMVNHAIRVVSNMIHSGRGPRVKTASKNPAAQIIAEMRAGKDQIEEIRAESSYNQQQETNQKVKGYSTFKTNTIKE